MALLDGVTSWQLDSTWHPDGSSRLGSVAIASRSLGAATVGQETKEVGVPRQNDRNGFCPIVSVGVNRLVRDPVEWAVRAIVHVDEVGVARSNSAATNRDESVLNNPDSRVQLAGLFGCTFVGQNLDDSPHAADVGVLWELDFDAEKVVLVGEPEPVVGEHGRPDATGFVAV